MDTATLIGFCVGWGMVVLSVILGGSSPMLFWDLPSLILVLIGSFGMSIASVDMTTFQDFGKFMGKAWNKDNYNYKEIITQLVGFSESARKDGLLSLDDAVKEVEDKFLATGLRLMVDGTDPSIIKGILESELDQVEERHNKGINLFFTWSAFAPSFGMLGTVMGLIGMMANLADTASIGKGMALALITTLYGSMLANLFCVPIAAKLSERHSQEMLSRNMMLEGVLSIQGGENPRLLEQKLYTFLPPKDRPTGNDD